MKNSSTDGAIGAAPENNTSAWSSPSWARMPAFVSSGKTVGSVTPLTSRAALIFSQMRGTASQAVGRASTSPAEHGFRVSMQVMVEPVATAE